MQVESFYAPSLYALLPYLRILIDHSTSGCLGTQSWLPIRYKVNTGTASNKSESSYFDKLNAQSTPRFASIGCEFVIMYADTYILVVP